VKIRERIAEHVCNDGCQWEDEIRWWCPMESRVVDCPGPCPDGSLHSPQSGKVFMHKILPFGRDSS
jgi:hypothetical protein